ncbi:mucin-19-like isoform X10 [Frieseomelitta varia]|uniref:mucin-19-like isoform X10 n=1 Tax=Frieseomelitta varia TaxID=561572 RepID=UPI001CB6A38E|nr:mucin-19-like isoform X10 [Frieseomelitta varia]
MIDRTCFAVLLGLLGLVCGLQCPKQRTSPGREVVCYTSVSDVDQLTEAVCKCTTLVQQGHDVRNLSLSEFEGFQKSLKKISPWLQFVVSVDDPGRTLRTSGTVRQEIIARLMGVLKEIDGVELNVTAGSKERLVHFVKGLKDELVRKSYDSRLFLVLPTNSEELAKQFDLKELTKYVDLFTVPTHYLIEDDATRRTFHPSRLMGLFDMFNADSLIDLISGLGVPKRKILISLPASAYKFTLKDQDDNAPGAPAEEIQPVIVDQKELCDLMNKGEWTVERDEDLTAPYAFKDKTWIAFEDRISVSIKGKYALIRELPGLAVHGVENDFKTKCGIPLTHEVHRSFSSFKRKSRAAVLNSLEDDLHQTELEYSTKVKSSDFRVVRVVDTEGHIRVVRENTQTEFTCSRQGYFVHPKSCNRFYRCVKFNQEVEDYSVFEFDCPAGLSFDERTEVCVWPGSLPEGSPCPGSSEIAPVPRVRFECPSKSGYYADPQNPRWFFACVDLGGPEITAYEFRCPFGLIFDEQKLICEWPWLVPGYSDTAYTRSEYYGTGTTAGTGGYYTGELPYGYAGSKSGGGYTGSTVATGSGFSGAAGVRGSPFGQGTGYAGSAGASHGTSYSGQGSGAYTGTTASGYSGIGAIDHGTSYTGQGSGVYSETIGSGYSGAGTAHGTSYTGQGSGVYSGTPGSGYSGAGVTHGTSYTGQGSGSGYSGTGATQGTSYTGPGSGVYSGTPGSGYSGAGGFGHETSGSGIYSGTTGSGYSGAGGVTHETSYTNQGTTGSGYSGSGADHGYSGTGTSYSETGHYGGSRGKEYSGGTIGTGYTGVGSIGHVGTTGSVAPGQGYTGKGFVGHDTSAGGYSATKGGSTGGYAGTSSGTHIIDHTGSGGYPGSTGSSAGIGYSGTGSAGITGYSGQTFGSGQSQTPVYPSSGAPGTGLEHGVTDIYSQTPRPLFADKPQTPTCVTINCYGFSQPSDGQTIVTGYVPSHGATGTNIYQGTTGFSRGLNATFGSHVPSIGGVTYYGGVTPTGSFGVATDTGGIVTGHGIQGSIITGDSTPGTLISHGGASGTVFTSSSNQGSITTGENHPGYTKTGPGSPGYVISDGVKTLFPGSASPGTTIYGTPAPGVVVAETPLPATVIRGQPSPGIVLTGQTVPGVSIGGSIVPGTVVSSSADFAHGGLDFSTPGSPFGTKIGTTPSTFDTGYKTNEYHDNGGRGTIRFNNGDVTTKYTENDIPDYRPTGGAIPPDTLLPGRKGPGAISTGFTKTGPTKTGFTTATLGAGGSYVISTGRTSPAPNPDHIGAKAFEGNVAGYTKSSTESSANAYTGATSTYRPNNLGYSYPTPSIPFDTGVTKNLPISSTESGVVGITTPTPFLSVDIYNTPKFGEITGSPTVASTYPRPSGFTRAPTATSTPLLYTTGPLENYKTTVFEAARIPVTVSTVQPLIDTGYKTVVSPTQVPVTISRDKFGTGPEFRTTTSRPGGTTVFKVSSKYPVGEPQYDYGPTTPSPAIGVTYGIPFSLPGVSYQQSTPLPSGSPTNVAIGREEVGKLVTNYNRGTTKYVPSQFDDGYAISRQNYGSSTTTYSAGYSRSSSLTTYQTTDKSTAVGRGKVIVKWSDLHPILLGKLGAECTCRGDPFANLRGPGSKLINSSKGKVDLSNYDESEIYVDLEKEGSYESQDYQVTNHESSSSLSSKQPVKIYNELSQAIGATSTQAPSFAYLPSVGSSSSGFTANFRSSAKSLSQGKRLAVERSVVDAPDDDSSSDRSEETDASEEIIDGSAHCARPGLFRHPNFCNKFYACHWDEWKKRFTLHVFKCPVHLTFDKAAAACNWPSMGPACQDDNLLV